jgi:putative ABC transport system permease protein
MAGSQREPAGADPARLLSSSDEPRPGRPDDARRHHRGRLRRRPRRRGAGDHVRITSRLAGLGTNLLTVNPRSGSSGLTLSDVAAVAAIPNIAAVAPELQRSGTVASGRETTTTSIIGTNASYPEVRAYDVWQGTFLTDVSVAEKLRVVVLGSTVADNLNLGAQAVGTDVTIDGLPFRVIGILQPKGGTGFQDPDDQVMVPIGVVQKYFVGSGTIRTIGISVASVDAMAGAKTAITTALYRQHGLAATATADFSILDQAQLLATASSIAGTLALLLGGVASISLVVGGIGIMNIMLVSVRERTREIGIRKAVGARGRDILAQFLIEALTLSLLGGMIGVVLGLAVSALIGHIAGWGFAFSPVIVAVALLFSLAVGIVFGVWPARQAARLDPISALRWE